MIDRNSKEYEWYKYLFNNVSIAPKDRSQDCGAKMYQKFAKAIVEKIEAEHINEPKQD